MLNNIKKRNEGFTIIEVLIVLAIAGLILLVVFLAVPALQRNSRNTQRKTDVAAVLSAVNEWSNNNAGKQPGSTGTERADALANAKLGFYGASAGSWQAGGATTPTPTTEAYVIATDARCNGNALQAGNRSIAVIYRVETGGGTGQIVCQDS